VNHVISPYSLENPNGHFRDYRDFRNFARRLILWCVVHAMIGLVSFSAKQRVPVLHALVNPSWHLTPGLAFVFFVFFVVFISLCPGVAEPFRLP
jgi:hypothetical protein